MFGWLYSVLNLPVVDNSQSNNTSGTNIPQPIGKGEWSVTATETDYTLLYWFIVFIGALILITVIYKLYEVTKENKQNKSKNETQKGSQLEEFSKDEQNSLSCLICDKNSNGEHFCKECFEKYKNSSLIVKINGCKETKIIDVSTTTQCEETTE